MAELHTLLTGLVVGESPRWHDGRLWFSNWGAQEIIAVDPEGTSRVMAHVPTTVPFSIDWLPDGRLLIVSGPEARLLRQEPDGSLVTHADLSGLARGWNEIVVDDCGNTYLNGSDYRSGSGEPFIPGVIALVTPDGSVRQVADDIHFPNGMVVTPDHRTLFKDGRPGCARVREGGEVLDRIELERLCFACMLGGDDGKTLFMLVAEWRGVEHMDALFRSRTGQVLATRAPAPHAGWP